jgi:hypothetical protein
MNSSRNDVKRRCMTEVPSLKVNGHETQKANQKQIHETNAAIQDDKSDDEKENRLQEMDMTNHQRVERPDRLQNIGTSTKLYILFYFKCFGNNRKLMA